MHTKRLLRIIRTLLTCMLVVFVFNVISLYMHIGNREFFLVSDIFILFCFLSALIASYLK